MGNKQKNSRKEGTLTMMPDASLKQQAEMFREQFLKAETHS
jgi:hypothetical protein